MGHFFFDESLHERGGFALGAWVCVDEDPTQEMDAALLACSLQPGLDEYKSGIRMAGDDKRHQLRDRLWSIFYGGHARVGLTIVELERRRLLGGVAIEAISRFIAANGLGGHEHTAYLDQGLFQSSADVAVAINRAQLPKGVQVLVEQNSREIRGLQLADLVAHSASTLLLAQMGLVSKTVPAGSDSGFDPEERLALAYVLQGGLRWNLFRAPSGDSMEPSKDSWWADVASRGLYCAPNIPVALREVFEGTFGRVWLGCNR